MADEYQAGICGGSWWDSSKNRFDSGSSSTSSSINNIGNFGWQGDMVDLKSRSPMDSMTPGSSMVFEDTQKLQGPDNSSGDSGSGSGLTETNLQMMRLGLSQPVDWNQALLRSGKDESNSFRSMLQEDHLSSSSNFHQETGIMPSQSQWRPDEYKQINRGFSLDQPQFSTSHSNSGDSTSAVTCQGLSSNFQMESSAVYGGNPSTILQGLLSSASHHHQGQVQSSYENHRPMDFSYPVNYGMNSNDLSPSLSKFPQFLTNTSPPKPSSHNSHLNFSNNAQFWNASPPAMTNNIRSSSSFVPSLQTQFPTPTFDEKPKQTRSEVRDSSSIVKKSSSEVSTKRPRNETAPSSMPPFKVRKEKMGDRITALQQLVSPFGKTDTASVLSEAIEYIKFLHEQVCALSTPYMKNGIPMQHQHQNSNKSKDPEGPKQDLRSRGLCLVPVSSTFPVTHHHETSTVDFWTPTYGGTFR